MLKKNIILGLLVLALVLPFCDRAYAFMEGLGIGIIAGEPTGLSVKKWINESSAVDAAFAWSFIDNTSFQIHADYLRHKFDLIREFNARTPFYYGIGGRLKFKGGNGNKDESRAGIRIPVGLSYLFEEEPVDIFIEFAPILDIAPETGMDLSAAIGIRYYLR